MGEDPSGAIRGASSVDGLKQDIWVRDLRGPLACLQQRHRAGEFVPLAFSATAPNVLEVLSYQTDHPGLYEFDTSSRSFTKTVAFDQTGTIEPLVRDNQLVGYTDIGSADVNTVYFDPAWAER